jgi:hypothetical protein
LDAADDDTDTEPEGANEEGFLGVAQGLFEVLGIQDCAGEHASAKEEESGYIKDENYQTNGVKSWRSS